MSNAPPNGYSQPTAPVYQTQPGPPPGYQGGPPPIGYQGGPPPIGYQGGPPPIGYQGGPPPGYGATPGYHQVHQVPTTTTTNVYVRGTGNCPACGIGNTSPQFTILGICLAILFFPIGILCCLLLTEKRCNNCGMTYS